MNDARKAVVVGAGIAGLACARDLVRAGLTVSVLEKSGGVGGRCATRRIDGVPVDHGLIFMHGSNPDFLSDIDAASALSPAVPGWPERIRGAGTPCQPAAFSPGERRIAFANGLSAYPKYLAQGLDVSLRTSVTRIERLGGRWKIHCESDGATIQSGPIAADDLVLAVTPEEAGRLMAPLGGPAEASEPGAEPAAVAESVNADRQALTAASRLLKMIGTIPCLTLIAEYAAGSERPDWHVQYPESSKVLALVSNDSSKRGGIASGFTLVFQARAPWTTYALTQPSETQTRLLLAEAAGLLGAWALTPVRSQLHLWRSARVEPGGELSRPLLFALTTGERLGITGEAFAPGAGAQGAWLAGRDLASGLVPAGSNQTKWASHED